MYNSNTGLNNHMIRLNEQIQNSKYIRSKKKYDPLPELKFSWLNNLYHIIFYWIYELYGTSFHLNLRSCFPYLCTSFCYNYWAYALILFYFFSYFWCLSLLSLGKWKGVIVFSCSLLTFSIYEFAVGSTLMVFQFYLQSFGNW